MAIANFQCKIRVEHPHDSTIFFEGRKQFSSKQEALDFSTSKYGTSHFLQTVVPLRTNTIKNFVSDLLFPNAIPALAEKTHHVAFKAMLTITFIMFDLLFLPVRLLTAVPRIIYNHVTYEEAKLLSFLKGQAGINSKLLDSERVNLKMTKIERFGGRLKIEKSVDFIELPRYPGAYNCLIIC